MGEHREFDEAVVACLLTLSEKVENLSAELAATRMALGVTIATADQAAILRLQNMVEMADDLTLTTNMNDRQRTVFREHLQGIAGSVAAAQESIHPGGMRGLQVAFAHCWANLRRTLVGAPWRGGILRGLALRCWTLGTARKKVCYAAHRATVLDQARTGRATY